MRKLVIVSALVVLLVGVALGGDKSAMRSSSDRMSDSDSRLLNEKIRNLETQLSDAERMLREMMEKLDRAEGVNTQMTHRELQKPFKERITNVVWKGSPVSMRYLGEAELSEKNLGLVQGNLTGIAFHPDGRIAISEGRGTHEDMKIAYWDPSGRDQTLVPLKKTHERKVSDSREKQGYFNHFAGPLTFDQNGTCYFSLGTNVPNGVYKVVSTSPVLIDKLSRIQDSLYLQVPPFDKKHIYTASGSEIHRIPIDKPEQQVETSKPWFKLVNKGVLMNEAIAISPNRLMANCVILRETDENKMKFEQHTLIFDKERKGFWSLPVQDYGAYAISWDGKRLIGFDQKDRMVKEMAFPNIPSSVQVAETD